MESENKTASNQVDFAGIFNELRHFLSYQGPIKDFIADNILYMFRDLGLTFHEALRKASSLYGALEYRPIKGYREAYHEGRISDAAISFVIEHEKTEAAALRQAMLTAEVPAEMRRHGFRDAGYLFSMTQRCGTILEEQVHPTVYRLVANFLDQGIASVSLSEYENDFWIALQSQFKTAKPFGLSRRTARRICDYTPEEMLRKGIADLLPPGADIKVFLLEILMAARGWSGIVAQVEARPQYLNYPRHITLMQYVALYLALLWECLERSGHKPGNIPVANPHSDFFAEKCPPESEAERIYRLWHDAMEMSLYFNVISAIETNAPKKRERSSIAGHADFHAVFCIDDREESIRRHLEEVSDKIETFGAPGFFGIDMVYRGPFDTISIKQCPVPVTPKHRIRGLMDGKRKFPISKLEMNLWHRAGNHLILGTIISLVFGLVSLIRLAFSVHFPRQSFATVSSFASQEATELHYERPEGEGPGEDGFFDGYTVPEMVERVGRILTWIGLTKDFGPLVAMVAHGSSSTNNPYFAAYDCGACSGRPGLANARAFALMANRDDVRALLKKRGIDIPNATRFIGALRDTTRGEVLFLDEHLLDARLQPKLADLKAIFKEALRHEAYERTRRFAAVPFARSSASALKEAISRSEMLFEPRPEYTHATNALGIVAPRSLTENLFLDRRAFFNSYDPVADQDGKTLSEILTPFVPVCGGINLTYYFSYLDNVVYGSGSKLPHNIFSLIGIGNGVDGDLRTGLPAQMVEIHDPLRLLVLIEQTREIVLKVFEGNQPVHAWIQKGWVNCCIYDYVKKKYFWYRDGNFIELRLPEKKVHAFSNSLSAFKGKRNNIEPAIIGGQHGHGA